jgi:hypothetical protein
MPAVGSARNRVLVSEALRLRDALLKHLGGVARRSGAIVQMSSFSPESWALLLRVECCALPIADRLRRESSLDRLPDALREVIGGAEAAELQRVLAARAILRELDDVAMQLNTRFDILKGGALACEARRSPLDLGDVDVLVAPERAEVVWDALLARGWVPTAKGLDPESAPDTRQHFAALRSPRHSLPLELHRRFEYGLAEALQEQSSTTPYADFRALDRLTGAGPLLASLRHSVVQHPHRRGHLRDLILLSGMLSELDEQQLSSVQRSIDRDPYRAELDGMLRQSIAIHSGTDLPPDAPGNRRLVVWKYATAAHAHRVFCEWAPGWTAVSHIPLEREPLRRAAYLAQLRYAFVRVPPDSPFHDHAWLRSSPARTAGLARVVRSAYRMALATALLLSGAFIRAQVRRLDVSR